MINVKSLLIAALGIVALGGVVMGVRHFQRPDSEPLPSNDPIPKRQGVDMRGKSATFRAASAHARGAYFFAERFRAETGGTIRVEIGSIQDCMRVFIDDWTSPRPRLDVVQVQYTDLGALVEKGMVVDLTPFYKKYQAELDLNDYVPIVLKSYTEHYGKRWAVPFDCDHHLLFYRKSLLKKYGFEPPLTWDDYTHIARVITEKESASGTYGSIIMADATPFFSGSMFMNRLVTSGGRLFDSQGRPVVNSPEAVQALQMLVDQSKYALPSPLDVSFDIAREAFLSGRGAMVEFWTDMGVMAEEENMSTIKGDWGVVPLPRSTSEMKRTGSALNAGWVLVVSSKAPHPEVAMEFLRTAVYPPNEAKVITFNSGIDPSRYSAARSAEFRRLVPEVSRSLEESFKHMIPWATGPKAGQMHEALSTAVRKAISGKVSAEEALDELQAVWTRMLETPASPEATMQ